MSVNFGFWILDFGFRAAATQRPRRHGMSILEVMFAILVTAIGLLGAIAVIPVANSAARKGLRNDYAAVMGPNAFHAFDSRGLRNPRNWMAFNTTAGQWQPFAPVFGESYCFDPRFVAVNGAAPTVQGNPNFFPYSLVGGPRMRRLTVFSGVYSGGGLPIPATPILANDWFGFPDDLLYDRPKDLAARQLFDSSSNGTLVTSRQSEGMFSWMATVTPRVDRHTMAPTTECVLSVVVFHQRPADLSMNAENERVLNIISMPSGGVTGGEVQLAADNPNALKLRPNDWLMLGGTARTLLNPPNATPFRDDTEFKWYRVVDCDPEVDQPSPGVYTRFVSLTGQDWNPEYITATGFPQATIVEGVVGVYEKTVHLELN
ncbi:MAG: hypothetical protein SFU86_16470 [Pirellulaceae bacterium]|nr:hypothetical protein [Pirellulaceae bacterium]